MGLVVAKSPFKTEKEGKYFLKRITLMIAVVVKDFKLDAGSYIILPTTYNKGLEGPFDVVCYSDVAPILLQKNWTTHV